MSQHNISFDSNDKDEDIQVHENIKNKERYNLKAAQALLLFKMTAYLSKNVSVLERNDTICKILCKNEMFLPTSNSKYIFLQKLTSKEKFIPPDMLRFWKDVIILLHKKGLLKSLIFKLLDILNKEYEIKERKTFAVLWINTIIHSFIQLDIAHSFCRTMEYNSNIQGRQLFTKDLSYCIKAYVYSKYPYCQDVLWIDISSTTPCFLFDINFVSKFLLCPNKFPVELVESLLKIVTPKLDANTKKHLINILKIYNFQKCGNTEDVCEKIYTVDDLRAHLVENKTPVHKEKCSKKKTCLLADQVVRNLQWKSALGMSFCVNNFS